MSHYTIYHSSNNFSEHIHKLRRLTWITYILYAATVVSGLSLVVGIVIAHLKEKEAQLVDPLLASHFSWLIRTFWWSLAWSLAAAVLFALVITAPLGGLISMLVALWFGYRIVRGALALHANKLMP